MGETSTHEPGRLRIGVDARELLGSATGVGRYLGELLLRWTARRDRDRRQFVLYSPEPLPLRLPSGTVDHRIVTAGGKSRRGTWWEQIHLRRAVAQRSSRCLLRPGIYRAARIRHSPRGDDPRHLVRGPSGVVPSARGHAPALADAPLCAAGWRRLHGLGVFAIGDPEPLPDRSGAHPCDSTGPCPAS